MQPLFQQGTAITLRLMLLIIVSVAIMTADHRFHHLQEVRAQLSRAIYPLQLAVNLPSQAFAWVAETWSSHQDLLAENLQLKQQALLRDADLQKLAALAAENQRLRQLLDSAAKITDSVSIAELMAVDLDPYRQQLLLNQGSNSQVFVGQAVIDAHGVMGQVIEANAATSRVLLISDPNHAVPSQITRTGLRSIAAGTGQSDALELLFIPSTADVQVGDQIITSGLGGRFPPDYPVGYITSVEHPPGQAFAKVTAKPSAELDRSREVLLVWHGQNKPDNRTPDPAAGNIEP